MLSQRDWLCNTIKEERETQKGYNKDTKKVRGSGTQRWLRVTLHVRQKTIQIAWPIGTCLYI